MESDGKKSDYSDWRKKASSYAPKVFINVHPNTLRLFSNLMILISILRTGIPIIKRLFRVCRDGHNEEVLTRWFFLEVILTALWLLHAYLYQDVIGLFLSGIVSIALIVIFIVSRFRCKKCNL